MKAMMLAAGFGTRLRPLTSVRPKPLFPLLGRPVMEHLVRRLASQGFTEISVNLHHLPDHIPEYFGDGSHFGVEMHYSREPEVLGTAGGILAARPHLDGDTFLVINSDIVIDLDLKPVLEFHRKQNAALTMVLYDGNATGIHDPIEMDSNDRIVHMIGASSKNIPNVTTPVTFTGIQLLEPEIFDRIPEGRFAETTKEIYPQMIEEGCRVFGYRHKGYWQDMGTRGQYLQAHRDVLDHRVLVVDPAPSAPPKSGQITQPVWIGRDCILSNTARIGPYAVLGDGCRVEDSACIENSVLWDNVHVQDGARITESVIGDGVTVKQNETVHQAGVIPKK